MKNFINTSLSCAALGVSIACYSLPAFATNHVETEYAQKNIAYESVVIKIEANYKQDRESIFEEIKSQIVSRFTQYEEENFFSFDISNDNESSMALYLNVLLSEESGVDQQHINELIESLQGIKHIALIYPQPMPIAIDDEEPLLILPKRSPTEHGLNYTHLQDYLKAADVKRTGYAVGGVDAYYAWNYPGGDGSGITVVQKENGQWNEEHEDLPESVLEFSGSKTGEHGTASMGIMGAFNNGYGVTGISHNSDFGRAGSTVQNLPEIMEALQPGDVVQIGMQLGWGSIGGCTSNCLLPMESSDIWFNFIKELTDKGIHVIQAAGNGGLNLDNPGFKGKFDRSVRDSGSIIVGAVCANTGNTAGFSNYGSRIDSASWGCSDVTTTGYSSLSGVTNANYTNTYSGTSAANPIVAGATASLSGVAKAYGIDMTAKELRQLMTDTGTPVGNSNKYIATQPDLRNAIDTLLDGYWNIDNLSYDLQSGRVDMSFNNRYTNFDGFNMKLTHNGKYAASCKQSQCYYVYQSVRNGIRKLRLNLALEVGDELQATIYDSDNNILAHRKTVVVPNWSISSLDYNAKNHPLLTFSNSYTGLENFFVKMTVNGNYAASCEKTICYYSYSNVTDGIKKVYKLTPLKSGDVLQATIHYGKDGIVVDRKSVTVH